MSVEYGMVSVLIPKEYEDEFRACAKNTMPDAANALQWHLYQGICANLGRNIPLFNLVPCDSFPQHYRRPFIPGFSFNEKGQNLPFCNVKLIRNYFKTQALKKVLTKWCKANTDPKTLFVYTLSSPLLTAISKVKHQYPDMHVCAIVADLPNMANLSAKKSILLKLFTKKLAQNSYSLLSSVDSFVLLTKYMADYMQITQPFCVMEGIAPDTTAENPMEENREEKIVLYTGTLHRKFGVLHLLEAFRNVSDPNARLIICGVGDSEAEIRAASKDDPRIEFLGQLRRDEVLELQKRAAVLVNPRLNNEEFTKYSFPSKTMEYLASGVPVIAYKLDGIPDEYDAYLTYPKDDSVEALTNALESLCSMDSETRRRNGASGKRYVLEEKNALAQTKRILDFLQALSNK
ncbi:MAG: glycosyltransferase [Ruminococcaceae bacterium]|nr:glycosyltransferase [Oscillospiraceae bacterium]